MFALKRPGVTGGLKVEGFDDGKVVMRLKRHGRVAKKRSI
jgi:hypothetical protein